MASIPEALFSEFVAGRTTSERARAQLSSELKPKAGLNDTLNLSEETGLSDATGFVSELVLLRG